MTDDGVVENILDETSRFDDALFLFIFPHEERIPIIQLVLSRARKGKLPKVTQTKMGRII
jgi:hypothetical protein